MPSGYSNSKDKRITCFNKIAQIDSFIHKMQTVAYV